MKKLTFLFVAVLLILALVPAVFANPPPDCGCTLTQGYWKNHREDWPMDPDTPWFDTSMTWFDVLWTEPAGGNAYYILAHQYIAATLNRMSGSCMPDEVRAAFGGAKWLLEKFKDTLEIPKGTMFREKAINWYEILDAYNNGYMGVPHCDTLE